MVATKHGSSMSSALSATPRPKRLDALGLQAVRHVREPQPIHFPESAEMPEGYVHLLVRTFLFQLLRFTLGDEHTVGSDQFVYWNAREPRRCLAPDVFVKLGRPSAAFGAWKTWELGGPPELAVEIVSPSDEERLATWEEKLARYHELGVTELVRFDPEGTEGARLRVWDRVQGDLVEREVTDEVAPCLTLQLAWVVRPLEGAREVPACLRLVDGDGALVLDAREAAEARVRELEAELARRR